MIASRAEASVRRTARREIARLLKTSDGRKALECALLQLASSKNWTTADKTRTARIAVSHVLSEAWAPARLERCLRLDAEGSEAPPIDVVAFVLHGMTLHAPSDGNHRAEAAREGARRTLAARICGTYHLNVDEAMIDKNDTLRKPRDEHSWTTTDLAAEIASILENLGVPRVQERSHGR